MNILQRAALIVFALIQLVLVSRILLDLGIIPADLGIADNITMWSDFLAAPVRGLGNGFDVLGQWGIPGFSAGEGLNPVMVAAVIGWGLVQALVMRVVNTFAAAL